MKTNEETGYESAIAEHMEYRKGEWVYMEKVVLVQPEIDKLNIRIDADGWGQRGGSAWFDDLKIEQLDNSQNEIVSETNYYPFGLAHKGYNEHVSSSNLGENYKYANKEFEEELEVNTVAFGWRDYDPATARFNKIDRFAEKYYDLTPYHYAANNPMYYMDIQGDSLWIQHKNNKILYQNGNLYNKDGSAYTGKGVKVQKDGSVKLSGFLKKTVNALGEIGKGGEGSAMISELQSSDNNFTIVKGTSSRHISANSFKAHAKQWTTDPKQAATYQMLLANGKDFSGGSGGTIYWNPSGSPLITTMGVRTNATTDLAHEMFHGLDANRGALDDRLHNGVQRSEWQATYRENMLRTQLGLPARTHYKSQLNVSTGKRTGVAPRMLNPAPANSPMLPSWYKK